jgi:hypothetical protein
MIGEIQIFLPLSLEEAEVCVAAEATTTKEGQLAMTVREEELEKTLESAQAGDEYEHYEQWLNTFSQEAEETTTLELVEAVEEDVDNISLDNLYEQIEALERRVIVHGMHIQQMRLEVDEDDMGDHDDLPIYRKKMQLRRLHKQIQPLEQLDEVIKKIRRLMIESAENSSKEKLGREAATTTGRWRR